MTMKRLFIYLSSYPAPEASWVALDEPGVIQQSVSQGDTADLHTFAQGYDITVIIPGEEVLLTHAQLPKLSRQRLLQALPYVLEEQLIDDVQQLHFAIGEHQTDGTVPVAIITREKIETYLAILKQAGISASKMIPATLALPYTPHHWQLCVLNDICLIRTGKYQGFACDPANLATLIALQLAASVQKPECLQINRFSNQAIVIEAPDITVNDIDHAGKNRLEHMSDWLNANASINLLQDHYASKQSSSFIKKLWISSGCVAVAWIALLFLSHIVSYFILEHSVHRSELAINAIYKKHFPAATSMVAPRERMQEKLKKLSSDASKNYILGLLGMIGNSLHQSPGVHVKQLDFRENSLNLTVTAASFDVLDSFSKQLKQQGLNVKQQSAGMAGSDVKANLIIHTGVA